MQKIWWWRGQKRYTGRYHLHFNTKEGGNANMAFASRPPSGRRTEEIFGGSGAISVASVST